MKLWKLRYVQIPQRWRLKWTYNITLYKASIAQKLWYHWTENTVKLTFSEAKPQNKTEASASLEQEAQVGILSFYQQIASKLYIVTKAEMIHNNYETEIKQLHICP